MAIFAIPGTKSFIECDNLPSNKLHPAHGGDVDNGTSCKVNYVPMNGEPPSDNHYAIGGEWMTPDQFVSV